MKVDQDKLYREIGKRIRAARKDRRPELTQEDLADLVGVERTSITNIEKGSQRATLYFLYHCAQKLSIPLERLLPALNDPEISATETAQNVQVKLGKNTKTVPRKVKSLLERI